jgi:hypothetical protein
MHAPPCPCLNTRVDRADQGFFSHGLDGLPRRYAETQLASNGLRYRDWLTVFASDQALEKCRLEGHVLDIAACHQAVVPFRAPGRPLQWVGMRSSLPLEQRVLHDRTPPGSGVSPFTAFARACKARLLQDLKNLPLPPDATLERHNVSVYEDERARSLLVVYAPTTTADKRLEFVCMTLLLSPGP